MDFKWSYDYIFFQKEEPLCLTWKWEASLIEKWKSYNVGEFLFVVVSRNTLVLLFQLINSNVYSRTAHTSTIFYVFETGRFSWSHASKFRKTWTFHLLCRKRRFRDLETMERHLVTVNVSYVNFLVRSRGMLPEYRQECVFTPELPSIYAVMFYFQFFELAKWCDGSTTSSVTSAEWIVCNPSCCSWIVNTVQELI